MAKVCERCKIMERGKYWNEFPATKHCFFKVMFGDFENQLRIPRKFINCFKGKLSEQCSLRGPSENKWRVRVEKTEDDYVFSNGWECFVRDHGLKITDFLVFHYVGRSSFKIMIFDSSGCEREGPYFAKNQSLCSQASCTSSLHREENDASECMSVPDEDMDVSMEDIEPNEHDSEASSQEQIPKGTGGNPSMKSRNPNSAYRAKGKMIGTSKSKGKKKKSPSLEELDMFENEDGEEEKGTEELSYRGNEESGCHCRMRGAASKAKQSQKYYISNRRNPTAQEKQRAYRMATSHMIRSKPTGLPMVEITMLPSHVYSGFHLTIPNEWALKHMLREDHHVELQVPAVEKRWTVGCRWTPSQCQVRAKWPRFVIENNLEQDDVCVFELVRKGDLDRRRNSVFKVHIFRAVTEIVPLTESRRMV